MTTQEIAARLVSHCRAGRWEAAQRELYADDAVSIEPVENPPFPRETRGLAAIIEKSRRFDGMIEARHSLTVSEPLVSTQSFACTMALDVTMKGQGRMKMQELCVYEIKDGKIVSERFFI